MILVLSKFTENSRREDTFYESRKFTEAYKLKGKLKKRNGQMIYYFVLVLNVIGQPA